MRAKLHVGWILLAIGTGTGAGCCLETTTGFELNTTGETSAGTIGTGSGTGTSSGGASTSGSTSSSTGGSSTGGPFFVGAVEVEVIATVDPDGTEEPSFGSLRGQFLPGNEWPACTSDRLVDQGNPCCFAPGNPPLSGVSAGGLKLQIDSPFGFPTVYLQFDSNSETYLLDDLPIPDGGWYSTLSAVGDVVPAFTVSSVGFPPPDPVVDAGLDSLLTLSTSEDWSVPLTPCGFEFQFYDRVILEVDGVGSILCQATEEVTFTPPLVVPAALLAKFAGQQGTVSIYRDEYTGFVDAGGLLVGYRTGKGVRTAVGAVSFTP